MRKALQNVTGIIAINLQLQECKRIYDESKTRAVDREEGRLRNGRRWNGTA